MRTRIYAGSALAVLAAIVVTAFIVTNPLSTEASVKDTSAESARLETSNSLADTKGAGGTVIPDGLGQLQVSADADDESKPYIGVVINPLSDGTVEVVKVLRDGPSDGVLEIGDVITAVNGEAIDGSDDLTDAIAETGSGETLTLTVTRDGTEIEVSVEVGEWAEKSYRKSRTFHRSGRAHDRVASTQTVMADDDGNYHTYRTVFGSVTILDEDAGTLTLQPKDDSDPIEYTVDDDTRIYAGKDLVDDLAGLDTDQEIVVMDVDGVVKVVKQIDPGHAVSTGFHKSRKRGFGPRVGTRFHRSSYVHPTKVADMRNFNVRRMMGRFDADVTGRMPGLGFRMDVVDISSILEGIDDELISAYAPDGFEESFERFVEDAGVGGSISVRRDGDGLNVNLLTEDGAMSFTIPASALNDEDSP